MKTKLLALLSVVATGALLVTPVLADAQNNQDRVYGHHHYVLVIAGTLGGPNSYFSDFPANTIGMLNRRGTFTGMADTPTPDPYAPDGFQLVDGYVGHAFVWQDGQTKDLGALPGITSSASTWISANGLVAGLSENGQIDPLYTGLPELHAVMWKDGRIMDLGTLGGGYESVAYAINSRGQVVGAATNGVADPISMAPYTFWLWGWPDPTQAPATYEFQTRAFLWDSENGMQDLGTLGTGTDAQAFFINERGQVAGISYLSTNSGACYGAETGSFIWDKVRGMRSLGGFGGTCTIATSMNQSGQVAGVSNLAGDLVTRPFLWDGHSLHDLGGTLGGTQVKALAINESGEVAGSASLLGDSVTHAVLWKHVGHFMDLGTVGNDPCAFAWAMNDSTQVVGLSSPSDCASYDVARPFLWENGSMVDLNSLIPSNSPLTLSYAYSINDLGEIVGNGQDAAGNTRAFLLIPCDEHHPGIKSCDYNLITGGSIKP